MPAPTQSEASPAQLEAGNYRKPKRKFQGLLISIENRKGSTRSGVDRGGHAWSTKMRADYGYIRGSLGVDGDHVDCYIGPDKDAAFAYVVHQRKAGDWKAFDEDKVMLGYPTKAKAVAAYLAHYDDPRFLGPVTEMPMDEFKRKVLSSRERPQMIKGLVLFLKAKRPDARGTDDMFAALTEQAVQVRPHYDKHGRFIPGHTSTRKKRAPSASGPKLPTRKEAVAARVPDLFAEERKKVAVAPKAVEKPKAVESATVKESLTAAAPAKPKTFTPTHEAADGTPLAATAETGVYVDADGFEVEDEYAKPLKAEKLKTPAQPVFPVEESKRNAEYRANRGDEVMRIDAKAFADAYLRDKGEPLLWKPGRADNIRELLDSGTAVDEYPKVGVSADGKVDVGDGRHRIAVAAERGMMIDVAAPKEHLERLRSLIAKPPATDRLRQSLPPDAPPAITEAIGKVESSQHNLAALHEAKAPADEIKEAAEELKAVTSELSDGIRSWQDKAEAEHAEDKMDLAEALRDAPDAPETEALIAKVAEKVKAKKTLSTTAAAEMRMENHLRKYNGEPELTEAEFLAQRSEIKARSKATSLRAKADKLAKEAMDSMGGIVGGQPVLSSRDRKKREAAAEKMRAAGATLAAAEAAEKKAAPLSDWDKGILADWVNGGRSERGLHKLNADKFAALSADQQASVESMAARKVEQQDRARAQHQAEAEIAARVVKELRSGRVATGSDLLALGFKSTQGDRNAASLFREIAGGTFADAEKAVRSGILYAGMTSDGGNLRDMLGVAKKAQAQVARLGVLGEKDRIKVVEEKRAKAPTSPGPKDAALQAAVDHLEEDAKQGDLPEAEKREDAALVAKLKGAIEPDGPREGDRNAEGLVFRDGRWHRDEETLTATRGTDGRDTSSEGSGAKGAREKARGKGDAGGADHWDALAGTLKPATIDGLRARAERNDWPPEFTEKLTSAIGRLPSEIHAFFDYAQARYGESVLIVHRKSLEDVPSEFRDTYANAGAITVNGMRIEFTGDRFPTLNTLRHELVHYAWSSFTGRNGLDGGEKAIDNILTDVVADGEKILKFALSKKPKDAWQDIDAKSVARTFKRMKKYQEEGRRDIGEIMRGGLELDLMVGGVGRDIAKAVGVGGGDQEEQQYVTVALYMAMAKRLGVEMDGAFAKEEAVAYRCGEQEIVARKLFGSVGAAMERSTVQKGEPAIERAPGDLYALHDERRTLERGLNFISDPAGSAVKRQRIVAIDAVLSADHERRKASHRMALEAYAAQHPRWYDVHPEYGPSLRMTPKAASGQGADNAPSIIMQKPAEMSKAILFFAPSALPKVARITKLKAQH